TGFADDLLTRAVSSTVGRRAVRAAPRQGRRDTDPRGPIPTHHPTSDLGSAWLSAGGVEQPDAGYSNRAEAPVIGLACGSSRGCADYSTTRSRRCTVVGDGAAESGADELGVGRAAGF